VCKHTQKPKCIFVGHSQGNAQAFLGFSLRPSVSNQVQLFVALAPTMYINPMRQWALQALVDCPEWLYVFLFGTKVCIFFLDILSFSSFPL
jgi:hypothetical protein